MKPTESVNISVFGRTYSLKSAPDKTKFLKESAEYMHKKMQEVSRNTGSKNFEGLAVAACLNIIAECDEKIRRLAEQLTKSTESSKPPQSEDPVGLSEELLESWNQKITELL